MRVWGAAFLLLFAAVACQLEEEPAPEVKSQLGGSCQNNGDCASGLICSAGTRIAGLCTKACDTQTECEVEFGNNTDCRDGFCVLDCNVDANCLAGGCDENSHFCVTGGACSMTACDVSVKPCCAGNTCTGGRCCTPTGGSALCYAFPCCDATRTCNNFGECI